MKALSLQQPYAELVILGAKTIELRSWNTRHRGEFLIHSSKTWYGDGSISDDILEKYNLYDKELDFGMIIGKANLIDVVDYCSYPREEMINDGINLDLLRDDEDKHLAWGYQENKKRLYGFILENPIRFQKPIPCKGMLNFFDVPKVIESRILVPVNEDDSK